MVIKYKECHSKVVLIKRLIQCGSFPSQQLLLNIVPYIDKNIVLLPNMAKNHYLAVDH